ncbi:MAG: VOC family protein [Pseudomonadota bacterium]
MQLAQLEHLNVTVSDPARTAERLCTLFGWKIRWQGTAIDSGYSVHVGTEHQYLALYSPGQSCDASSSSSYHTRGGLNHVGLVVEDIEAAETAILAAGYESYFHADYAPGRRFYFRDEDGIEFEIISYTQADK